MKYIDEFRDARLIKKLAAKISSASAGTDRAYNIMEVCGTHTMNVFRFGLGALLPPNIRLVSGPGCPVCVTPNAYIDKAVALAGMAGVTVATFGDMMRVPGTASSLEKANARYGSVKAVYSSLDALDIARRNPSKEVVFLGIGFETTAPTVARSIFMAASEGLKNYSVLCGHKTMPAALKHLARGRTDIDAFLLPGHVSAVIGKAPYGFLSAKYKKNCVISGFEPLDILQSILMIIRQRRPKVEIQYGRIAAPRGNPLAVKVMCKVFEKCASQWRGFGVIAASGLKIRGRYGGFDAEKKLRPRIAAPKDNTRCFCAYVLKGVKTPPECPSFARACTPEHPAGACMVSSEGTCAAYYKYSA
jgi:hydrogenase expression/formation protein HypD